MDDTNYKQLLIEMLKELCINIQEYGKKNKLSSKTT